jgi:hypothetical protein
MTEHKAAYETRCMEAIIATLESIESGGRLL